MGILIEYPFLAFIIACIFAAVWRVGRNKLAAVAALAWACYTVYEYLMHLRILCTGECNIRVDLLLFYPILLVLSIAAIVQSIRNNKRS